MLLETVFFFNIGKYLILWKKYGITSIRKPTENFTKTLSVSFYKDMEGVRWLQFCVLILKTSIHFQLKELTTFIIRKKLRHK